MDIRCDLSLGAGYKSNSQLARRMTEHWCARELYCAACHSDQLQPMAANTPSTDFVCPGCAAKYQLKSSAQLLRGRIVDAAYSAMIHAIRTGTTPHLLALHYTREWLIENVVLVPAFFLVESTIERRKPLAPTARRSGWVGCNILLGQVPSDGKISIVASGHAISPAEVRAKFSAVSRLERVQPDRRGWLIDVLRIVQRLTSDTFDLAELYRHAAELSLLHPNNRNVKAKIRQQLQVLRDLGFIHFRGNGHYSIARGGQHQ